MRRSDGVLLKSLDPFVQIIPYIMEKRSDAISKHVVCVDPLIAISQEKRSKGLNWATCIFHSSLCQAGYERPQLNRFIVNSRIYQRNKICISMAIKRSLRDEDDETTVKFEFTGQEMFSRSLRSLMPRSPRPSTARIIPTQTNL